MVRGQRRRFPVWPADQCRGERRDPLLAAATDACALFRAEKNLPLNRTHGETTHAAKSRGGLKRRTIARINATTLAMNIRALVTSLTGSTPERLYEFDYCARGQAPNLIKLHKTQLKSDPTSCHSASCHSALANQVRLILHTAAYCLLCSVRRAIPETHPLRQAECATLQRHLVKTAARVIETATRIRIACAAACPDKAAFINLL